MNSQYFTPPPPPPRPWCLCLSFRKEFYSYWFQVTHILNVAYGVENAFPDLFIYKTISVLDLPDTDIISHLHECTQFIDQAKEEVSVLIHTE